MLICSSVNLFIVKVPSLEESKVLLAKDPGKKMNAPVIKNKCRPPEILAPAGDMEALKAAVKGGADAVYLGVGEFNARQGATNFTLENLEESIDLAHSYNVKVFLALNIPIKEHELPLVLEIVDRSYVMGIDAVIIEDMGLVDILHNRYPDLPLHISTQVTVHNTAGVHFLEQLGVSRVILSRELTTDELKHITENTNLSTEIFIHGALCYSYSGRCLFSSFLIDRSANRGACAQPCRRRYKVFVDGRDVSNLMDGAYPISCAELCTLGGIREIIDTGVKSLKIEGRMKKPEYVTASSRAYKTAVEKVCASGNNLEESELVSMKTELAKLFYRGFTDGFVLGAHDVTHAKYSSNYGVFLGKVKEIRYGEHSAGIKLLLEDHVHVNDGVSINTNTKMLGSKITAIELLNRNKVERAEKGTTVILQISAKTAKAVRSGDEVYLSTDTELLDDLQKLEMIKLPVDIHIKAFKGQPLSIKVTENRCSVDHIDEYQVQEARSAPTTQEQITKAIDKLGDTPYHTGSIVVEADDGIFIPVGILTSARRNALEKLRQNVLQSYKRTSSFSQLSHAGSCIDPFSTEAAVQNSISQLTEEQKRRTLLSVEVCDVASLFLAARNGADVVYLPLHCFEELSRENNHEALHEIETKGIEVVFITPQITHDHELEALIPLFAAVKNAGYKVACSNLGAVRYAMELNIPFVAQKEFNIFNSHTASRFFSCGAYRITLSSELNLEEIENVCKALGSCKHQGQVEVLIHGRELMLITNNDLLGPVASGKLLNEDSEAYLEDQQGSRFPVKRTGEQRTLIYDSKVLNMAEHTEQLLSLGVHVLRLDLSLYRGKAIRDITRNYRLALDKKRVKPIMYKGEIVATGHFFKGV
jgi:putative protease